MKFDYLGNRTASSCHLMTQFNNNTNIEWMDSCAIGSQLKCYKNIAMEYLKSATEYRSI